jgi:hypothetical protein
VGLRDFLRRHIVRVRREPRVEFLGEQDGAPERELKTALVPLLSSRPAIHRAYLARVGFQPAAATSIALCLDGADSDSTLIPAIHAQFRVIFSADAFVDILFLSRDQSLDVARVCSPFYSRAI